MKTILKITCSLFAFTLLSTACSKDDDADDVKNTQTDYNNERLSGYVSTSTNLPPGERLYVYDDLNRNKEYIHTDLGFSVETKVDNHTFKDQYILNSQKLVSEMFTQQYYYNYKTRLTYDNQKRIIQITIDEQQTNNAGSPTTNMQLIYTIDFTWNDEHNVTAAELTYSPYFLSITNTGGVKYVKFIYSGYSEEFTNTLKLANIGLDYFGPYGFPSAMLNLSETKLSGPFYMGKHLPTTTSSQGYSENHTPVNNHGYTTNYTFEKDSKGRIVLLTNGYSSYHFSYK